jgi:general secretion pathway protein H
MAALKQTLPRPSRTALTAADQSGFSLVEVLAVMALVGLLLGLVGTSIYRSMDSVKVRRVSKDVTAALRYTRGQAIITRSEQYLEVNMESRTYQAPGKEPIELPEGVDVTLKTALADIIDNTTGRIRFFPDGSSTGGRMTLIAGTREWRVNVGWLTGEITVEDSLEFD